MSGPESSLVGSSDKFQAIFLNRTSSHIIGHSLCKGFRIDISNEPICHAKGSFWIVGKVVVVGVQSVRLRVMAHP